MAGLKTIEKTNKTVANVTLRRNFLAALNDFHRDLPNASLMKEKIIYGYRYCGGNEKSLEFMECGTEETKVRNIKNETIDLDKILTRTLTESIFATDLEAMKHKDIVALRFKSHGMRISCLIIL